MIDAILDADFIGDRFSLSTKSAMISMPNGQMQYKNCLRTTMLYAPEIKNRTCNFYGVQQHWMLWFGSFETSAHRAYRTRRFHPGVSHRSPTRQALNIRNSRESTSSQKVVLLAADRSINHTQHTLYSANMATELTVQSERAFQKQPHIFLNSKRQSGKTKRVGKGGRRWHKDVGLGFRTPATAINGSYIGRSPPVARRSTILGGRRSYRGRGWQRSFSMGTAVR